MDVNTHHDEEVCPDETWVDSLDLSIFYSQYVSLDLVNINKPAMGDHTEPISRPNTHFRQIVCTTKLSITLKRALGNQK